MSIVIVCVLEVGDRTHTFILSSEQLVHHWVREQSCICLASDNQLLIFRWEQVEYFWLNALYSFEEGDALLKFLQFEMTLEQGNEHLERVLFADLLKRLLPDQVTFDTTELERVVSIENHGWRMELRLNHIVTLAKKLGARILLLQNVF